MNIVITGGASGGHIFPAIGIAKAIQSIDTTVKIYYIGCEDRLEAKIVPQNGFEFIPIASAGFPRSLSWRWFSVIAKVAKGIVQSLRAIRKIKPQIAIGTGGYVSGPVLFSAMLQNVPIVIQEQNGTAGLTNRILDRWATAVYLGISAARKDFPNADLVKLTGNPIRTSIGEIKKSSEIYRRLELNPDRKTVFVMGGSQGAKGINRLIIDSLSLLEQIDNFQIIHQTGSSDFEIAKENYRNSQISHLLKPFFDNVNEIYAITDLMICRAGAMTIAEIATCKIPAIFIPLPTSAEDHQRHNAEAVAKAGGGVVLDQLNTTSEKFVSQIETLISDQDRLKKMGLAIGQFSNRNAAIEIAKSILEIADR